MLLSNLCNKYSRLCGKIRGYKREAGDALGREEPLGEWPTIVIHGTIHGWRDEAKPEDGTWARTPKRITCSPLIALPAAFCEAVYHVYESVGCSSSSGSPE
jgi:hypothetical protein